MSASEQRHSHPASPACAETRPACRRAQRDGSVSGAARHALLALIVLVTALTASAASAHAQTVAGARTKVVSYHGVRVTVPASWPVYRLGAGSHTCVRFNRHAVYLGQPGTSQSCPTAATGHTEAIAIAPLTAAATANSAAAGALLNGNALRIVERRAGAVVTATWGTAPRVIVRALSLHSLRALRAQAARSVVRPARAAVLRSRHSSTKATAKVARANAATTTATTATTTTTATATTATTTNTATTTTAAAQPGQVYNGSGFDACSTPTTTVMSNWSASPFRAIGVYIGGTNMACTQTNLTSAWVSTESTAGWHLIPIYVGLQAPGACSGCAALSTNATTAASEGTQAAIDAVVQAQAVGLGTGNPIYDDMEAYSRTTANTTAVLAFLQAWTIQLRTAGYLSGVYSSDASGIADLVAQAGTSYTEPNEIWFANWNGAANVNDSYASTTVWPAGQRLHQYAGSYNATYGGTKINIDADFVDAATAAYGGGATAAAALPTATGSPTISGTPLLGQLLNESHAQWSGNPTAYGYQWQRCNSTATSCTAIAGATAPHYRVASADIGYRLEVLETATNGVGTSTAATSTPTFTTHRYAAGLWLFSAAGQVYNSLYEPFYGSPASAPSTKVVGMATTSAGYWLADRAGQIFHYGTARSLSTAARSGVVGIAASGHGGVWLVTAAGRVYNSRHAGWYGSLPTSHIKTRTIVGIAATSDGRGYWLVSSNGAVYAFGDARKGIAPRRSQIKHPIIGIVAGARGGYWLYTASGNIYRSRGNGWYGSLLSIPTVSGGSSSSRLAAMVATSDGRGYWLATTSGTIYSFGDATSYPALTPTQSVVGAA